MLPDKAVLALLNPKPCAIPTSILNCGSLLRKSAGRINRKAQGVIKVEGVSIRKLCSDYTRKPLEATQTSGFRWNLGEKHKYYFHVYNLRHIDTLSYLLH